MFRGNKSFEYLLHRFQFSRWLIENIRESFSLKNESAEVLDKNGIKQKCDSVLEGYQFVIGKTIEPKIERGIHSGRRS